MDHHHLPEDVLIEILLRLPVESLIRLRCVCKCWCALIKSPSFIAIHLSRAKKYERVLIKRHLVDAPNFEEEPVIHLSIHPSIESVCEMAPALKNLPFSNHDSHRFKFLGNCNGLICIRDVSGVYLFNPAMREHRLLPPRPFDGQGDYFYFISDTALGHDAINDDYKVVNLVKYRPCLQNSEHTRFKYKAEIYSLKTDNWREIDAPFPVEGHYNYSVLFNGFLHWGTFDEARKRALIPCLHMSDEVFREIELPADDACRDEYPFCRLAVVGESLAFLSCFYSGDDTVRDPNVREIDAWVMKEYGVKESWTRRKYSIRIGLDWGRPLGFWNDEFLLLQRNGEQQLIFCPLTGQQLQKFVVWSGEGYMCDEIVIYKESLISIKRSDQLNMNRGPCSRINHCVCEF